MREEPIRVLQCLGSLNVGGIETWLMNIIRLQPKGVRFDFFLMARGGTYENEAVKLGSRVYHAPVQGLLGKSVFFMGRGLFYKKLEEILRRENYNAFHIHGDEFFGDPMKVAARVGTPVRVVHCHNTVLARGKKGPDMFLRKLRLRTLERARIRRYATDIVACSSDAGRYLMGREWESDNRCRPLYCGVSLDALKAAGERWTRESFRDAHGIPRDAWVVGHAGSMGPSHQKNHFFLIDVFAELARRDPKWFLFLAGDGPHKPAIAEAIKARELDRRVAMPGVVDNVPALMMYGFDVHLLPSLQEGLPVVGLEAVGAGLYTVCSTAITRDYTQAFPDRILATSLSKPVSHWADCVEQAVTKRTTAAEGLVLLRNSPFSIDSSLGAMIQLYENRMAAL